MSYWLLKWTVGPILRFFYRVRVEGREHIPASGPCILASNHLSFSDSIFLPLMLKRRVTFVAKAEYFDDPKTAWFFTAMGQIPIRRDGGSASEGALAAARDVLRNGGLFGIYPEGTRSPDGRLYKGHTGIARLALETGAPICVCAMIGTREAQPIGRILPRPFVPVTIRISPPLAFERDPEGDGRMAYRAITDEIMYELRERSDQVYVDRYCKRGGTAAEAGPAAPIRVEPIAPPPVALTAR